jgi:hypothetical protein
MPVTYLTGAARGNGLSGLYEFGKHDALEKTGTGPLPYWLNCASSKFCLQSLDFPSIGTPRQWMVDVGHPAGWLAGCTRNPRTAISNVRLRLIHAKSCEYQYAAVIGCQGLKVYASSAGLLNHLLGYAHSTVSDFVILTSGVPRSPRGFRNNFFYK